MSTVVLPGPIVLRPEHVPPAWRRCDQLGCGAPTGHEGAHVDEAVPPVAVAGPEVDVAAEVRGAIGRAQHPLDSAPASVETALAIDALESAEALASEAACERRIPDVIEVEAIAADWPEQWRSLVAVDPSTLTPGGRRRRDAMLAIADHVCGDGRDRSSGAENKAIAPAIADEMRAPTTRAARIEAAARALVQASETTYALDAVGAPDAQRAEASLAESRAYDALRAALCSCSAHGPDPACVEHGAAIRARMAGWSR